MLTYKIQKEGELKATASGYHTIVVAVKSSTKTESIVKLDVYNAESIASVEAGGGFTSNTTKLKSSCL